MFKLVFIVSFTLMAFGVASGNHYDCQIPDFVYACSIFQESNECNVEYLDNKEVDRDAHTVNTEPLTDINFDINIYNLDTDTYYKGELDTMLYGNYSWTLTSDQMKEMRPTYFRVMVNTIWLGLHDTVYYKYMVPKDIDYGQDSTFSFQECANVYTTQDMWVEVMGVHQTEDKPAKTYTKVCDSYKVVPDCCSDLGKRVSGCDMFCINGVNTENDPSNLWSDPNEDKSENQVILAVKTGY